MLEAATSTPYEPGWNVKGDAAAATWVLLLERVAGVTVVAPGRHAPATVTALDALFPGWRGRRSAADVVVVARGESVPPWASGPGVTVVRVGDVGERPDAALVPVPGGGPGDESSATLADRPLHPVRSLHVPFAPRRDGPAAAARLGRVLARARVRLGAGPAAGAARTASLRVAAGALGSGTSIRFAEGVDRRWLPGYVRDVALASGCDLGREPWALVAAADYWSQKALFLTDPVAVKVSRLPRFSARLANEYRGLVHVAGLGWGEGRSPAPVFAGEEAGLAVVGEGVVRGEPLESRTDATPSCPLLRRAVGDLRDLAAAAPSSVSAEAAAAALGSLLAAFTRLVDPPPAVRGRLATDVEDAASAGVAVVVHGDPAVWNLVALGDGAVGFLDWENFEAAGPPFWDLALLVQTAGALAEARRGRRYTAATLRAQLLDPDSPWKGLLDTAAAGTARDLGIDAALLAPFVRLWLMFQGLKEATRHAPGHRGLYTSALLGAVPPR